MEQLWIYCWIVGLAVVSAIISFGLFLGWLLWS